MLPIEILVVAGAVVGVILHIGFLSIIQGKRIDHDADLQLENALRKMVRPSADGKQPDDHGGGQLKAAVFIFEL